MDVLEQPDAILDPRALPALAAFITNSSENSQKHGEKDQKSIDNEGHGGDEVDEVARRAEAAVGALVSSYAGVPDAIALVASWEELLDSNGTDIPDVSTGSMSSSAAMKDKTLANFVWDSTVKFVLENFDAEAADEVLEAASGVPIWLRDLLADPRFRPVFFDLAQRPENSSSVLINYAVQKFAALGGCEREIAALPLASSQLAVFRAILPSLVTRALSLADDVSLGFIVNGSNGGSSGGDSSNGGAGSSRTIGSASAGGNGGAHGSASGDSTGRSGGSGSAASSIGAGGISESHAAGPAANSTSAVEAVQDLTRVCTHAPHTMLFALTALWIMELEMLSRAEQLASQQGAEHADRKEVPSVRVAGSFRRIRQELERAALQAVVPGGAAAAASSNRESAGATVTAAITLDDSCARMVHEIIDLAQRRAQADAGEVGMAIQMLIRSMTRGRVSSVTDAAELCAKYGIDSASGSVRPASEVEVPISIEYIRTPQVLEFLVSALFTPASPTAHDSYLWLFAAATTLSAPNAHAAADAGAVDKQHDEDERHLLRDVASALMHVRTLCNATGSKLLLEAATVRTAMRYPGVSMGVLHWLRSLLCNPGYCRTTWNTPGVPVHLELLRMAAAHHAVQCSTVLALVRDAFDVLSSPTAMSALQDEFGEGGDIGLDSGVLVNMRLHLADVILYVMCCSPAHVDASLTLVANWVTRPHVDLSIVRHFVVGCLSVLKPPFAPAFVARFAAILGSERFAPILRFLPGSDKVAALQVLQTAGAENAGPSRNKIASVMAELRRRE